MAHGVGGRAEADVPLGGGVRGAFGDGAGVTPVRGGPGRGDHGPVARRRRTSRCRAASSSSTAARSAAVRHAVSRTSRVARHSFSCPVSRAARVCGISVTRALARPRSRPPLAGDSRRARAICAPIPAPSFSAGTPAAACSRRWSRSKATASRACSADAADFQSSSSRIRSMIPALSGGGRTARTLRSRCGGDQAPGAAQAGVAVSCRSHFGPLIAVHESSVSGTSDNNGRRGPPRVPTARRRPIR